MTRITPSTTLPLKGEGARTAHSAPHTGAAPVASALPSPCQEEGQGGGHPAPIGATR